MAERDGVEVTIFSLKPCRDPITGAERNAVGLPALNVDDHIEAAQRLNALYGRVTMPVEHKFPHVELAHSHTQGAAVIRLDKNLEDLGIAQGSQ